MDDRTHVRQAADILEVIGAATVLKQRRGPWHEGLCPFHTEKTPSFRVNADEGFYRCFGCGAKGDVFSFVMQREGLEFRGALRLLADRYGIALTEEAPEAVDAQRRMREALGAAQDFFCEVFRRGDEGAEARTYAERRALSPEILDRFGIGAAPRGWDSLAAFLGRKGFDPEILAGAGLVSPGQRGGHIDYFRGRLMFPICTDMGTVVGFGGRVLRPEDGPKYLNSRETALFQKGQQVFALHLAKEAIRQADRVLVAEGYMDVVALHQAGIGEAVGVLGTAMTGHQARSLLRYTRSKRVVVAFDADRAGQEAARKGIDTLEEVARGAGLFLTVLAIPDGKDPDEYVRAHGAGSFRDLIAGAPDILDFQIGFVLDQIADPRSGAGKHEAINKLAPLFSRLDSPARAEPYYRKIAARLGISEYHVTLEFNRYLRHNGALRPGTRPVAVVQQRVAEAERGLTYLMVTDVEVRRAVAERLAEIPLPTPACQAVRQRLAGDLAEVRTWPAALDALEGTPEFDYLLDLRFEDLGSKIPSDPARAADNYIDAIAHEHWKRIASSRLQELGRPDLGAADKERLSQEFHDAQVRAEQHRARLSGQRSEPAATGS